MVLMMREPVRDTHFMDLIHVVKCKDISTYGWAYSLVYTKSLVGVGVAKSEI